MPKSFITQQMLNYYDETDTRTREHPWTIEAQLLNSFANSMEEMDTRFSREVDAVRRGRTPLNLDNRGLWYQFQLPFGSGAPATVTGYVGTSLVELQPYNDIFPVPSGIEYDFDRSPTPLADPKLFSLEGTDTPYESGSLEIPVPNRIYFKVDGLGDNSGTVDILVEGHVHPRMYWASASAPIQEKVEVTDEGVWITAKTWEDITNISVRNLPTGASLIVYSSSLALPYQPDTSRPFTDPAFRDVEFARYWGVDGRLVKEMYFAGRFAGYNTYQTYYWSDGVLATTVEPNTYGLLVVTESGLFYTDRREQVPDNLYRTALTEEPLYGLQVDYDPTKPGDQRFIILTPIPYAGAASMTQYRYWVQDPDGVHWAVTKNGDLAAYTSNQGWLRGTPGPISMSLPNSQCGTWMFVMECIDQTGHRNDDRFPYLHASLSPMMALDTSRVAPTVAGVMFDSRERLWIWTGDLLIPARLRYDAYVYDTDSNSIFLTDSYEEVSIA